MALQNLDKHKPDNNVQYTAVSFVYSSQKCMELALYLWERQGYAAQERLDEVWMRVNAIVRHKTY